jgi:hypothetical protein
MRDGLGRGPEMNMGDEAGLGLTIHWVQQALIQPMRITVLLDLSKQVGVI